MDKKQPQKIVITTKDGQPFNVPPEGSLGLLALGYKGLVAWRQSRRQFQKAKKEKMAANSSENDNLNPDNFVNPGDN